MQIFTALEEYEPIKAKVLINKLTGVSKGYAFVEFMSKEQATFTLNEFEKKPLIIENRLINMSYADNNKAGRVGQDRSGGIIQCDWICSACQMQNFARKITCYKCGVPKPENAVEVPTSNQHSINFQKSSPPATNVLVVRFLPYNAEESHIIETFTPLGAFNAVRLVRDKSTGLSKGFGFIEYSTMEEAAEVLRLSQNLTICGTQVHVTYARDAYNPSPAYGTSTGMNDIAGGGRGCYPNYSQNYNEGSMYNDNWENLQFNSVTSYSSQMESGAEAIENVNSNPISSAAEDDVNAFLEAAAAETLKPRKLFPLPFEIAGGSYVYSNETGLYYEPESMFYYDTTHRIYYNSFTGKYYMVDNATSNFTEYHPPLPVDDAQPQISLPETAPANTSVVHVQRSPSSSYPENDCVNNLDNLKKKSKVIDSVTIGSKRNIGEKMEVTTAVSSKKAKAKEIAKWNSIQRPLEAQKSKLKVKSKESEFSANDNTNVKVKANSNKIVCMLCKRKFLNPEHLNRHKRESKLHQENLMKAKGKKENPEGETKNNRTAKYRDRAKERRDLHGVDPPCVNRDSGSAQVPRELQLQELDMDVADKNNPIASSNIGSKILQSMGWKEGKGLGKNEEGRIAPIEAKEGYSEKIGVGNGNGNEREEEQSSGKGKSIATMKEKILQVTRARYEQK